MTVQLIRVEWTSRDLSGTTSIIVLEDVNRINIKKDSEAKASYANIYLQNAYSTFQTGFNQPFTRYNQDTNDIAFKEGDSIKIYAAEVDSFRAIILLLVVLIYL